IVRTELLCFYECRQFLGEIIRAAGRIDLCAEARPELDIFFVRRLGYPVQAKHGLKAELFRPIQEQAGYHTVMADFAREVSFDHGEPRSGLRGFRCQTSLDHLAIEEREGLSDAIPHAHDLTALIVHPKADAHPIE